MVVASLGLEGRDFGRSGFGDPGTEGLSRSRASTCCRDDVPSGSSTRLIEHHSAEIGRIGTAFVRRHQHGTVLSCHG